MSECLLYEQLDSIVTLTLNKHETRNAISEDEMVSALVSACERINADQSVRVAILTGAGSAFSSGGNIKDMKDKKGIFGGGPAGTRRGYVEGIQKVPKALYTLDIPSISAVQGPAIGAGCDLALYCDIIIASANAKFGETFINVGIIPGDGGAWILPRRVGLQRAAELIFTGRIVNGKEAAEIGLALECVQHEKLMTRVTELAETIAARPPVTARMLKSLLRQSLSSSLFDFLDNCAALQAICHSTDDHLEAVTAMLEKREPTFTAK